MHILSNAKNLLLFIFLMPMAVVGMDHNIELSLFIISQEEKLKQKEKESDLLIGDIRNFLLNSYENPTQASETIENLQVYEMNDLARAKKSLKQNIEFYKKLRLLIPENSHQPTTLHDLLSIGRHQELSTE